MAYISAEIVAKLAASIGHQLRLEPRQGSQYLARCTCGYLSAKRRSVAIALEAAEHHQEVVVRQYMATGKSWPKLPLDTPSVEHDSESRSSLLA